MDKDNEMEPVQPNSPCLPPNKHERYLKSIHEGIDRSFEYLQNINDTFTYSYESDMERYSALLESENMSDDIKKEIVHTMNEQQKQHAKDRKKFIKFAIIVPCFIVVGLVGFSRFAKK